MTQIFEVKLSDMMPKIPEISHLQIERDYSFNEDDLFICALGFEDRCLSIPQSISKNSSYQSNESIYFEYSTNREDNEINRVQLIQSLKNFSKLISSIECDEEDFAYLFRQVLNRLCQNGKVPKISFDISVCSSKLLLSTIKILFEYNVNLKILYSEARTYKPKKDDVEKKKSVKKEVELSKGSEKGLPSKEYPGLNLDNLPEAIIAFATFNPDRTKTMIASIDPNLITKPNDRLIWIIGIPHRDEDTWRSDYQVKINEIQDGLKYYKVSTFDYRETLKILNKIYDEKSIKYHFNVSPLGSKMQSLGIALFAYMKPDITIHFVPPEEYCAINYSEGCRDMWMINFGNIENFKNNLDEVGILRIKE